jgi:3-isopropylmalate dehydrogenase
MKSIIILPGDGVGPEVSFAANEILQTIADIHGHEWDIVEYPMGGCAIDAGLGPLPLETLAACQQADAIFLGAVGGPKWSDPRAAERPEQGLLELRKQLGLYANLRPLQIHPSQMHASPLKAELLQDVDIMFVRELIGGIYFGAKHRSADRAVDECVYTVAEVERIVRSAAQIAMKRRRKLTSVDKANVLETSRLWRETTERVIGEEFPEIELEHVLIDAMTMHLLTRPRDFDVIVTSNMFGDILTDEASALAGSLGMLPSASVGASGPGVFEPIHGSAPDIAGRGIANPYGAILSIALLLRHSLHLEREAIAVEDAVAESIRAGFCTPDMAMSGKGVGTDVALQVVQENLRLGVPFSRVGGGELH